MKNTFKTNQPSGGQHSVSGESLIVPSAGKLANTTPLMKKIAKWITLHEKTLRSLYREYIRETKDTNTPFIAFASHMYGECKH